jgi:hypothetical protein
MSKLKLQSEQVGEAFAGQFLTAFRKKSPILKECEGANRTNE